MPETLRCASVTFREIATEALAWSDAHKRSNRMDHGRMKKLLNWFGNAPLDSITPQEVERRFQGEFRTAATWNRYRALLSLTYCLAIRNGRAKENPARLVPHKVEHNERTRILAVEEEKKLRTVIIERFPERLPEFDLALHTGMRHCEQYGARWQDVDFEHRILTVLRNKGGRTSHVRLNDAALSALLRLRERTRETGYVCGGSVGATDWFEDCLRATGITGFVALSQAYFCLTGDDGWCRSAYRGRIAEGQDATHGEEVFASSTGLHPGRCAADGGQVPG